MPAVAIARVCKRRVRQQAEEIGRQRRRQEAGQEAAHHAQAAGRQQRLGLELGDDQHRPQHHQREQQSAQAPAGERVAQAAPAAAHRRPGGAHRQAVGRRRAARAPSRSKPWGLGRQQAALGGVELVQHARLTSAAGASKTTTPARRPTMRSNHFSARSTACSDATSVAPVASALRDQLADRQVGQRRVERRHRLVGQQQLGRLVEHARHAHALQLAAGEPVAAVEQPVGQVQPGQHGLRAGDVGRHQQRGQGAPARPGAQPARQHRGDDAQPRRNRRRLVDQPDARAQRLQRPRAQLPGPRRPAARRGLRWRAARWRRCAAGWSCPRPRGR